MPIPTEPIGSLPRPAGLVAAMERLQNGTMPPEEFSEIAELATRETILRLEQTGSPVITDGEQSKPSFATYPIHGMENLSDDGAVIEFSDGHTRQLPRLTKRAVPVPELCGSIFEGRAIGDIFACKASCYFRLGTEPLVSRSYSELFQGTIH